VAGGIPGERVPRVRAVWLDLGIKPEPKALNPKYPNPYPFSPKSVTQIVPAGNETDYPNLVRA
jgi:hypothetical protein